MATPATYRQHTYCSFCGRAFAEGQPWPRHCASCGSVTYRNPLPVAVVLVPVGAGVVVVRRAIPPRVGQLALPGGFINHGEGWQAAGAREVREETGLEIDPAQIREFAVRSAPDGTLLVFGVAAPLRAADLPPFAPNDEASERVVLDAPVELAFPLHSEVVALFFARPVSAEG
jgi:ADP-ribose pyrophosphatase YjhB (NUDIX family)